MNTSKAAPLSAHDIESLERATVSAVSPQSVEEIDGWLLPFDTGTVSRARSAVPLVHLAPDSTDIDRFIGAVESRYTAHGLQTWFRLADSPCFGGLRQALARRGYQAGKPVLVQTGSVEQMRRVTTQAPAQVDAKPDSAWAALFLGAGFDPVDGASRVQSLSRARGSAFASVRESGKTVAAGAGAYSRGWASVHGMRTELACRGRGLAGRVLAALADEAVRRGLEKVFLQVEEASIPAQALYRRAGFTTAWRYEYWSLKI